MLRQRMICGVILAVLCFPSALLVGCGGGVSATTSSPATPAAAANLNGNWLLVGTLPFSSVTGTPQNSIFGLAGTFNVVGTNIEAVLSENVPCPGGAISGPATFLTGTAAGDGTFSMQGSSLLNSLSSATLSGAIPASGSGSWSGHVTFSSTSSVCPTTQTMNFTAVRIADVTGTYAGTATLTSTSLTNPGSQTVGLKLLLQQGGASGSEALTGTLTIQGSSCLSGGTLQVGSGVLGSVFAVEATMNDGSSLLLSGLINDPGSAGVTLQGGLLSGGSCGGFFLSGATLTR